MASPVHVEDVVRSTETDPLRGVGSPRRRKLSSEASSDQSLGRRNSLRVMMRRMSRHSAHQVGSHPGDQDSLLSETIQDSDSQRAQHQKKPQDGLQWNQNSDHPERARKASEVALQEVIQVESSTGDKDLTTEVFYCRIFPVNFPEVLWKRKLPLWVTAVCTLLFLAAAAAALTLAIQLATESKPCCPKKWIWTEGRCYYFSDDTADWKSSQQNCSSYGGSLALLKNKSIMNISTRYKDGRDYWIGLRKTEAAGEQKWQWVDGSPFQNEVAFIESEGPELDCAYLNSDKAGNLDCASMRPWICVGEGN